VTSRLGTGKSFKLFYSVLFYCITGASTLFLCQRGLKHCCLVLYTGASIITTILQRHQKHYNRITVAPNIILFWFTRTKHNSCTTGAPTLFWCKYSVESNSTISFQCNGSDITLVLWDTLIRLFCITVAQNITLILKLHQILLYYYVQGTKHCFFITGAPNITPVSRHVKECTNNATSLFSFFITGQHIILVLQYTSAA
jgi:hypothetical protein